MPGPAFRLGESAALHTLESDDLEFVKRLRNDPSVRWATVASTPTNDQTIETWFEEEVSKTEDEAASFLVVPTDGSEPVGHAELSGVERPAGHGTVSWAFDPDERDDYVTETVRLLTGYGIEERRLHRVRTTVLAADGRARRALETVGFTEEETRREELFVDGTHRDAVSYSVLEDEWGDA